jgi:energy-coupling factor transporter transmembrane protein EcfT|tara:strand:- start:4880 stop:5080 length:201 start_codon:yes stop_codon:yes gene_type:complete
MGLFGWYAKQIKKLHYCDIAAIKTVSFLIGIIVGAYYPDFVMQYLWVIIAIIIVLTLKLLYKIFKK